MPENLTVLPATPTVNAYEIIGKIDDSLGGEASAIAPGAFNGPGPKSLLRVLPTKRRYRFLRSVR